MQLELDDRAAEALREVLSDYLPGLSEEIGKTENYDLRAELHRRHDALAGVLFQLGGGQSAGDQGGLGQRGFIRKPR